jgi:O-antigen ligase
LIYVSARATTLAVLLVALALLVSPDSTPGAVLARTARRLALLVPLFLWMLLSALWSLDASASISVALRLAGVALGGAILAGQFSDLPVSGLRRPVLALATGLTAAAAVVAVDLSLGGLLARALHPWAGADYEPALLYARAATLHSVFVLPLLVVLLRLKAPRLALLHSVVTVLALLETVSLSAKLALAVAAVTLGIVYLVPVMRWAGLGVLALAAASLPFVFPVQIGPAASCWMISHKPSALHRILIWNFVAEHIHERPLMGWGLDAARRLPGGKDPVVLKRCAPDGDTGTMVLGNEILPLHPHNGILQVWLELGGIGALLGFGPFLLGTVRVFTRQEWQSRSTQAMLAAGFAAALSVSLISFGIWQEWFLAGLCFAVGLLLLAARLPIEAPA